VFAMSGNGGIFAGAALGFLWLFILLLFFLVAVHITLFVFWLISIIDLAHRKNDEFPNPNENSKTTWLIILLVTLLVPVAAGIAGIVYFVTVMKKVPRKDTQGENQNIQENQIVQK